MSSNLRLRSVEPALRLVDTPQGRTDANFQPMLGVLVLFSPAGELLSIQETVLPTNEGFRLSGLTVSRDRWTWFVEDWNAPTLLMASFGADDPNVRVTPSALRTTLDPLLSFTSLGGQLYVTGLLNANNVIKALWSGTPFIARMSPDGTLSDRCVRHAPGENVAPAFTLFSGEDPLLMVRDGSDLSMYVRVYRLQAVSKNLIKPSGGEHVARQPQVVDGDKVARDEEKDE